MNSQCRKVEINERTYNTVLRGSVWYASERIGEAINRDVCLLIPSVTFVGEADKRSNNTQSPL
jgi:hypothetical protein